MTTVPSTPAVDPAVPATRADAGAPTRRTRSTVRAVAVPSEHGGWGLTAEPVVLGLLVAPSISGLFLGVAAVLTFLAHTPLRIVLVDRHRHRRLDRTRVAVRVLAAELAAIASLVLAAVLTSTGAFWWPALIAAPLIGVSLWFDTRSRSRRLAPELAGTVGISSVAALIVLAGGHAATEAVAAWLVLSARAITALPHVRAEIAKLHGKAARASTLLVADLVALIVAALAVVVSTAAALGAIAVAVVVAVQMLTAGHAREAKVVGIRQMLLGFAVVVATAAGLQFA
jgi:hypothetical protein